jgi:pimeloyl-ACP methyl ester carboxylesterase
LAATTKSHQYHRRNNKSRRYIVRLPNNYDRTKPHRLIFGVHWRDADYQAVDGGSAPYYGLRNLATGNYSTIFVAPDGLNKGWANSGGEDVLLFDAIIKALSDDLCINEKLIFSLGFSYGAAMSYSLACSRPKVFRAVAVLSGAQLSGCSGGTEPVVCSPCVFAEDGIQVTDKAGNRPFTRSMVFAIVFSVFKWANSSGTICSKGTAARAKTLRMWRETAGQRPRRSTRALLDFLSHMFPLMATIPLCQMILEVTVAQTAGPLERWTNSSSSSLKRVWGTGHAGIVAGYSRFCNWPQQTHTQNQRIRLPVFTSLFQRLGIMRSPCLQRQTW